MTHVDLKAVHAGRSTNVAARAQWVYLLAQDIVTVQDLLDAATAPSGKPLRALTLRRILVKGAGMSRTKAGKTLDMLDRLLETETERRKMTVGWLLDPNSRGRRYQAWLETHTSSKSSTPWNGFPFTTGTEAAR